MVYLGQRNKEVVAEFVPPHDQTRKELATVPLKSTHTCQKCKRLLPRDAFDSLTHRRGFIVIQQRCKTCRSGPDGLQLPGEEWRPLPGFDLPYEISNLGRVRRNGRMHILIPNTGGYWATSLRKGGRSRSFAIHRLVAHVFLGPRPAGMHVNHIDSNRKNAAASNLEYVTPSGNTIHAVLFGRHCKGERASGAKLTEAQVLEIRASSEAPGALAQRYGVATNTVRDVVRGQTWKHLLPKEGK